MMKIAARHKNSKGQSSVETAFALLIALAFFMFLWDGINLGYNWVSLQFVLGRGLQDVQMQKSAATTRANITANATSLGVNTGLVATVRFGGNDLAWHQGPRPLAVITLQRTVDFGPFLRVVFQGFSMAPQVTIRVHGYAETPP
ncbi:MAG: hypothetical protein ABH891_01910 [Candidatus Omnitrophota bacterium]